MRLIIGVSGRIRAGKSTAASYINRRYGAYVYRNSAILEELLARLHLDLTRNNYARLGAGLFKVFGRTVLAEAHAAEIQGRHPESMLSVIDGIRFPEEVDFYRQFKNFRLLYLRASDEARYDRSQLEEVGKKADDRTLAFDDFCRLNEDESERYLPILAEQADAVFENSGGLLDLERFVDDIIERWRIYP